MVAILLQLWRIKNGQYEFSVKNMRAMLEPGLLAIAGRDLMMALKNSAFGFV